jgi:hypothetical protein
MLGGHSTLNTVVLGEGIPNEGPNTCTLPLRPPYIIRHILKLLYRPIYTKFSMRTYRMAIDTISSTRSIGVRAYGRTYAARRAGATAERRSDGATSRPAAGHPRPPAAVVVAVQHAAIASSCIRPRRRRGEVLVRIAGLMAVPSWTALPCLCCDGPPGGAACDGRALRLDALCTSLQIRDRVGHLARWVSMGVEVIFSQVALFH